MRKKELPDWMTTLLREEGDAATTTMGELMEYPFNITKPGAFGGG